MARNENEILGRLKPSAKKVHDYIQEKSKETDGRLRESMAKIGENIGLSDATVHRSVRILQSEGIIGIVPSSDKTESNEIIYYGVPDEEKEVNDILTMASDLNSSLNRFQALMKTKDDTIRSLQAEKDHLLKQVKEQQGLITGLQDIVKSYENGLSILSEENIIGITELGEDTKALIFKEKN
ncbi:hypothetical protein [Oceanobacillus profundus]|uniref:Uncharacterized protein n=1 Tax=Oceanobacillus profundus TaxID=372463 RepID=A0A417YGH9_9BACI|nr:hypothetical protein [Oceanobacillus profundus]MBR2246089.1 hypothetical protein [Bacilli bacterium]MBR3119760.1 hypothetical protein [Oceanobacillus sp.]RHW31911.1 hypothetical protein D1B32_11775 [Oceanobacillus profundus]